MTHTGKSKERKLRISHLDQKQLNLLTLYKQLKMMNIYLRLNHEMAVTLLLWDLEVKFQ